MQKLMLAAIGAASLFAVPAFAQSSNAHGTTAQTNGTSSSTNSSSNMSHMTLRQVRQKITNDLRTDGYQDVRVIPDSFLVHARNKQGDPVVMIINPDSVFAVTGVPRQANASNPNGTSNGHSSLGSSSNSTSKQ
jgi:hypothetical protein